MTLGNIVDEHSESPKPLMTLPGGANGIDIYALDKGYEAMIAKPTQLSWEEENGYPTPELTEEERYEKIHTSRTVVYEEVADHYVILEKIGDRLWSGNKPIDVLEPDTTEEGAMERCLELITQLETKKIL